MLKINKILQAVSKGHNGKNNLVRVSSVTAASLSALNALGSSSRTRLSPSARCSYSNPIEHENEGSKNGSLVTQDKLFSRKAQSRV